MDTSQIKDHMEVVGSDGEHVGIVDHLDETGTRIKLTRRDSKADGVHHFLPVSAIASVDQFVTLSMTAQEAHAQWECRSRSLRSRHSGSRCRACRATTGSDRAHRRP